jgi:hypothetical protein
MLIKWCTTTAIWRMTCGQTEEHGVGTVVSTWSGLLLHPHPGYTMFVWGIAGSYGPCCMTPQ